jgi:fatty acid kinase fatty acid binding subunit
MELTASNTAIVLDSTADFPEGPQRFPSWRVVPLYVRFGDDSYRDYVDLSPREFYERLRAAKELPTTSQPTPGDFLAAYEELSSYERIYSLQISAKFSGTIESARLAAEEEGSGRVRVVDTTSATVGVAMLTLAIQRRLDRGTTDEEVAALIETFKRDVRLVFTVDTLEYLAKGGRIGRASAWAGELLQVKPILTISDGEIVPIKRVRGNRKAFQEFVSRFEADSSDSPTLRVGIAHADAPEREQALRTMVAEVRPSAQVEVASLLGPVVGTHAGPGTVGFFWFDDRE